MGQTRRGHTRAASLSTTYACRACGRVCFRFFVTSHYARIIRAIARMACIVLALAAGSCVDRERRTSLHALDQIEPFASFQNVQLPIRLSDLSALRPAAESTDFGLSEKIGPATVYFYGVRPDSTSEPVPRNAPVRHIEAAWDVPTDDSAAKLWSDLSSNVSRQIGKSPQCIRPAGTAYRFRDATWSFDSGIVYLSRRFRDSVRTGGQTRPVAPALSLGYAMDSAPTERLLEGGRVEACN